MYGVLGFDQFQGAFLSTCFVSTVCGLFQQFVVEGFDQFQGAFLSTCFVSTVCGLFQQFVVDAGSVDGKKQEFNVAQSAKVDSATVPLQHHQFELPVDGKDDLETFSRPASPHDRDVMPKARGVM